MFDQVIDGPDRLERALKVLIEKRDACSDPDEAAFLTSIIRGLEKRVTMVMAHGRGKFSSGGSTALPETGLSRNG